MAELESLKKRKDARDGKTTFNDTITALAEQLAIEQGGEFRIRELTDKAFSTGIVNGDRNDNGYRNDIGKQLSGIIIVAARNGKFRKLGAGHYEIVTEAKAEDVSVTGMENNKSD